MDRSIVYPGSIPLDTDLLNTNRNTMIALGALAQATLGTSTVTDGLAVAPTAPASLTITCGPGSITQLVTVDQNAYGSLAADTTDALLKMGVNLTSTSFTLAAPTTTGQSIAYLLEAAFQESDTNPAVLPYYNAASPASPYLGPSNTGVAQATERIQRVQFQIKASAPAVTGTQVTPTVDSGWSGLAVITVAYGQTQITATNITQLAGSPALQYKLPALRPGFSQIQAFTNSGTFTVPIGVTRLRVTVIGGGGAGGTHPNIPSGGGGAGGVGVHILSGLTPGSSIAVTVGTGGAAITSGTGNGGNGGTSSFGTYVSATGGTGGGGNPALTTAAGGTGGTAVGGDINSGGSCGTDSIIPAARGGDGGGPGGGRGTTGSVQGLAAQGYGGGGGGGGASNTSGTGAGSPGGNGAAGIVIVEY
jgi:hypothetical protein